MSGYVVESKLLFTDGMLKMSKNHLIETASASTGSLLIWDTGEYEMLPYRDNTEQLTDDELSSVSDEDSRPSSNLSDSEKLHAAFRDVGISFFFIHSSKSTETSSAQDSDSPARDPFTT